MNGSKALGLGGTRFAPRPPAAGAFVVRRSMGWFVRRRSVRSDAMPRRVGPIIYGAIGSVLCVGWPRTATPLIDFQF